MFYNKIKEFKSKKNKVALAESNEKLFIIKEFSDEDLLKIELEVYAKLKNKLNIPNVIKTEKNLVVYEYIKGQTLLSLLENETLTYDILSELIIWISSYYKNTNLILADAHLRNFIYTNEIYGVDFETAKKGEVKEDIASFVVFILTYNPAFTDYKIKLSKYFINKSLEEFKIDKNDFKLELLNQIQIIQARRKTVFLNENELENLLFKIL